MLASALALAQEQAQEQAQPPAAQAQDSHNIFGALSRWFDEQTAKLNSAFKDAGRRVEDLGHEAGQAAKTTASGAKDAATAVVRLPGTRVIAGHEKCLPAPNGAPDCVAAANAVCKAKGFETGKSVDTTTAEVCPPKVYMSGRSTGPGCSTETFVSRAICQ